jgi:hypothetical protein
MQTLGLSDSTPRTEGRLKSLFWPSITNDADVDYLTTQGFWVCMLIAVLSLAASFFSPVPMVNAAQAVYYLLAAIGVRERSRFAALCAFLSYALAALVAQKYTGRGIGVTEVLFMALLLANVRAVWLADAWRQTNRPDESPDRMAETLMDRISDQMPPAVWPAGRFLFYVIACVLILYEAVLLAIPAIRSGIPRLR